MWLLFALLLECHAQMPHVWWHAEGMTGGYQMWASPVFNNNGSTVYVGSQDHRLYAFNALTGEQTWQLDTGGMLMSSPSFDSVNELVVVGGTSGKVTAVKASGPGTPGSWNVVLQGAIHTTPATSPDGSKVFVTTDANTLDVLNATTGETTWSAPVCDGCPPGTEVSDPLVDQQGTMVIVGGASAQSLLLNGSKIWKYGRGITRKASVFVNDLVVLSDIKGVFALDKNNGTLRWKWDVDKQLTLSSPVVGGNTQQLVIVLGDDSGGSSLIFALNLSGSEKWRLPIADHLLRNIYNVATFTPDGKMFLVTGISGNLYGIDLDGELRWVYLVPGANVPRLLSAPLCDSDTIYLATANNSVFSFEYQPATNKSLTMADYIRDAPDLQEFNRSLVLLPDLRALLSSPGNWTFFVPSDDAIRVFTSRIGGGSHFAVWLTEQGPHVFKYYLLRGAYKSYSLSASQFLPTMLVNDTLVNIGNDAQPLLVSVRGPEDMEVDPTMGLRAVIQSSDLRFSNGVIHVIDSVILPPNRSTEVLRFWNDDAFADLASQNNESLTVFDLTARVTIFAPSNEAMLQAAYWVKSVPKSLNATLANFHVIPQLLYSANLKNNTTLTTVTGDSLLVTVNASGSIFVSDGTVKALLDPLRTDRLTQSGVIHFISEVLAPAASIKRPIGANMYFDRSLAKLSNLVASANYSQLSTALNAAGNLTFFAPTEVSPRDTSNSPLAVSPDPVGFLYHVAPGWHYRTTLGEEFFPSLLTDGNWTQLKGAGQAIHYVKLNESTEITYGVPGNPQTTTEVTSKPVLCSNGMYVRVDQWMIPPPNIEEQLNAAQLSQMVKYLKQTDLMDTLLQNMSAITIFAPDDLAFLDEANWVDTVNPDVLQTILQHHIVIGAVYSTALTDGLTLTTLNGDTLIVRVKGGNVSLTTLTSDGSSVVLFDVLTSNGVIHAVNTVMSPPSRANNNLLVNMAYRKELSWITSRIVKQPQFASLNNLLSNKNHTLTVFMPNNLAWESATLTDQDIIDSMLYSMMNGSFPTSSLLGLQFRPSLLFNTSRVSLAPNQSQVLQIRTSADNKTVSVLFGWDAVNTTSGTASLVARDVRSSNGYLHVVDNVILVPPSSGKAMNLSGLDRLAALVVRADVQPLYDTAQVTIFAASGESLESIKEWAESVQPNLLAIALKFHVVPKVVYSTDLHDGQALRTVLGQALIVQIEDDVISLETPEGIRFPLTRLNLLVANGVIHEVEQLLDPPAQTNLTLVDNIALQPELYTLSGLLSLPEFQEVKARLLLPNVTLLAPNQQALTRLANSTDLVGGVVPGYFPLTLNQSLSLLSLPFAVQLSSGQTLSPTLQPTTVAPTPKPKPSSAFASSAFASSSSAFASSAFASSDFDSDSSLFIAQDIPGPLWPADGGPLFVETFLSNATLPNIVRLRNRSQSVRFNRLGRPNETVYSLTSGPNLDNWTALLVRQDLRAANGFIHIVDQVVAPAVPLSAALPAMGLKEMAKLLVPPSDNTSHWLDREDSVTVFATVNQPIIDARKLEDLVPETMLRRQTFKGVLTVGQLKNIANLKDKTARHITMMSGDLMAVSIGGDGAVHVGDTHIDHGDFLMTNGVMHIVDGLLVTANDNSISAWVYVGIAAGVLLVIAAAIYCYCKRSRESQNFDFHRIPDKKRDEEE